MTQLNVGWAGLSEEFLDEIIRLNDIYPETRVTEMYGSARGLGKTARSEDRLPAADFKRLEYLVYKAHQYGICLKWTLNFSCFGGMQDLGWPEYRRMVARLMDIGVRRYIVTIPLIAELMRTDFPSSVLEVSTISRVTSITSLRDWYGLGVDGVCWDVMENRNYTLLDHGCNLSKERGGYVEVLVNELCTMDCLYRNHCYNLSSHNSTRTAHIGYPFGWCISTRAHEPWRWIATRFVLPEHLTYYEQLGVDRFKISGRTWPPDKILPIIKCYMRRESPPNLLDLWPHVNPLVEDSTRPEQDLLISTKHLKALKFLEGFRGYCSTRCQVSCRYCNEVFEECTSSKEGST